MYWCAAVLAENKDVIVCIVLYLLCTEPHTPNSWTWGLLLLDCLTSMLKRQTFPCSSPEKKKLAGRQLVSNKLLQNTALKASPVWAVLWLPLATLRPVLCSVQQAPEHQLPDGRSSVHASFSCRLWECVWYCSQKGGAPSVESGL